MCARKTSGAPWPTALHRTQKRYAKAHPTTVLRTDATMTMLPPPSAKKLGLVIDLDTCVGCHACAVACKEWNSGGVKGPFIDEEPFGEHPFGVWVNRVHSYEVAPGDGQPATTLHFPRSCLHCDTPA